MKQQNIYSLLGVIEKSLAWADKYKDTFPKEEFKDYFRKTRKIKEALEERCSAAAYGESQVGKSYLMDSLLGSSNSPFRISNAGQTYSFINEINSSGGNNSKVETTGVITRFTINRTNEKMKDYIKIRTLSIVDIILLLADSYYNDVEIERVLNYDQINERLTNLSALWRDKSVVFNYMDEYDIRDIEEYLKTSIGAKASMINASSFFNVIAPNIKYVPSDKWVDIFGLIWNANPNLNNLFVSLIEEYKKIKFAKEVYVPFASVLRSKGTLLKIDWLNLACGMNVDVDGDIIVTDVFDAEGNLLCKDFPKAYMSALIAELTFVLPEEIADDRDFLHYMDLLDFPGARSREELPETKLKDSEVLARVLRRGKVAYLFNKYSNSLRIGALLYCHHESQKEVTSIGRTLDNWITNSIGDTPKSRTEFLTKTNGVSPLFLIATKFNNDLRRNDAIDLPGNIDVLKRHWERFNTVLPEIIHPYTWLNEWELADGSLVNYKPFQNIYPLRDFYWSNEQHVFDGYSKSPSSTEVKAHIYDDYPDFFDNLRRSFLECPFVKEHFKNPEKAWNDVATPNNDGSRAIITGLNSIACVLDMARSSKYQKELDNLCQRIIQSIRIYYQEDSDESKNKRLRMICSDIRMKIDLSFGTKPDIFGKIIDKLMVQSSDIRKIANDIIIRHTDVPKDFTQVHLIRTIVGIDPNDSKEDNINKLCKHYSCEIDELEKNLSSFDVTIEDVISGNSEALTTESDVLTKHIIDFWTNHINQAAQSLNEYVAHADEIVNALLVLLRTLNVKRELTEKIANYQNIFSRKEDQICAIADLSTLILNNFVSNVGRTYMTESDIVAIRKKSEMCGINVDLSDDGFSIERKQQSIESVLDLLAESEKIMRNGIGSSEAKKVLRKLPLYDNFLRWENLLLIGLLLSSDITICNPEANNEIGSIIKECEQL